MSTELPPELEPMPYGPVTAPMVTHLHAMRPWLLFLAIMGFIGTVLLVGMALLMAVMGASIFAADGKMTSRQGMVAGLVACLVYLAVGALYGFWSLLLLSSATAVAAMTRAASVEELTAAMELTLTRQRRFWKVTGIAVIVSLVVYLGLFVVIMIVAVAAAAATGAAAS